MSEHKITVIKVEQLLDKNGQSSATHPCLVYFESNTNINFVTRHTRYCCDHRIKWDHFRTPQKNKGIQCKNCQRMGHMAKNCGLPYRCVKCTSQHLPGQCPKLKTDKPVCVNCSKYHTSNWRGCEVIKTYNDKRAKNNRTSNSPTAPVSTHTPVPAAITNTRNQHRQIRTFSDVMRQNTLQTNQVASHGRARNQNIAGVSTSQSHPNTFSFLETEVNNLFDLNLSELVLKMREFLPKYHAASDNTNKQLVLLSFLFTVLR